MMSRSNRLGIALACAAVLLAGFGNAWSQGILDDPARPAAERERDAGSRPLEVYAFFGVEPGMTVVDLMPGGGYNTFILSKLVGESGHLMAGPDGRGRVAERVQADGLSNVQVFSDIAEVEPASVDVMITIRNIHDLENRGNTAPVYAQYLAALKPGGIFGVVDARTPKPGVDESTHRINEQYVIDALTAAGFELVDRSEMLAVPDDDVDASGRGNRWLIDRFTLKFRRPG